MKFDAVFKTVLVVCRTHRLGIILPLRSEKCPVPDANSYTCQWHICCTECFLAIDSFLCSTPEWQFGYNVVMRKWTRNTLLSTWCMILTAVRCSQINPARIATCLCACMSSFTFILLGHKMSIVSPISKYFDRTAYCKSLSGHRRC